MRSMPTSKHAILQRPASSKRARAATRWPPGAAKSSAEENGSLGNLQSAAFGGGHHVCLIHWPHTRRTDLKCPRIRNPQQVEILLLALREIGLENRYSIIVHFPAGEKVAPPRRPVSYLVQIVALDEFGARRNRILHHQIFPLRSGHGQANCDQISRRDRPVQRNCIVDDALTILRCRQTEIIAEQIQ